MSRNRLERLVASFVAAYLETACSLLGHPGGCGLLNRRFLVWYVEVADEFLFDWPSPTVRLWRWAVLGDEEAVVVRA